MEYVERYWPHTSEGGRFEIPVDGLAWVDHIADRMDSGHGLIIDYGYTTPETIRFPQGTLMSYSNHIATPSVLENPGLRDITAHVPFDAIIDRAVQRGFEFLRTETLAALVLRGVQRNPALVESFRGRQQLKTLLFGMGETYRCVMLRKQWPK
jgi:SAM-dependent MidA family methyltransferase